MAITNLPFGGITRVHGKNQYTGNGMQGMQSWECYMLLKFGKGNFGVDDNREYLIELPCYPEQVTESITPRWESQSVIGRSADLSTYSGVSLKSVNFSLDLHRDLITGSYSLSDSDLRAIANEKGESYETVLSHQVAGAQYDYTSGYGDGRTWYVNINKILQMACYPLYTNNGTIPPTTYFVFGSMILKGYLTSYSTTWKKPLINSFYAWNTVDISMECYPDSVISADEMLTGNSSTQNTYNTKFPSSVGSSNTMNRSYLRPNLRRESHIGNLSDVMIT